MFHVFHVFPCANPPMSHTYSLHVDRVDRTTPHLELTLVVAADKQCGSHCHKNRTAESEKTQRHTQSEVRLYISYHSAWYDRNHYYHIQLYHMLISFVFLLFSVSVRTDTEGINRAMMIY